MRVAAAQCPSVPLDVGANLATVARLAEAAVAAGAELLVLPELFLTGPTFAPELWAVAPRPGDATEERLSALAAALGLHLVVGSALRRGDDLANAALCVPPDGGIVRYAKQHLFAAEPFTFRPGADALVWQTAIGRIGVGICYDMLFATPWARYVGVVDVCALPVAFPELAGSATEVLGVRVPTPARPCLSLTQRWADALPRRIAAAVGAPVALANLTGSAGVVLLDRRLVGRLVFAGGAAVYDGGARHGCAAGVELALADVAIGRAGDARAPGAPYAGVAADRLPGELRAMLLGLGLVERGARALGYPLVRAFGRRRAAPGSGPASADPSERAPAHRAAGGTCGGRRWGATIGSG